jgi:plastocyanin
MNMRSGLLLPPVAVAAVVAALAAPALAADQSVVAKTENVFAPRAVAVKPGETVTITNEGGEHDVVWNDNGAPPQPARPSPPALWPDGGITRTFTKNGRYRFYCQEHADRDSDFGMVGYVHVNAAGVVPPTVSALTATATRTGVRLGFRASRAGTAKATFFKRTGRRFVRNWTSSIPARRGTNSRRIATPLRMGTYRVDLVLTDADGVASTKRTKTFAVR